MPEPRPVKGSLRIVGSGRALPSCPTPDGVLLDRITNADLEGLLKAGAASEREGLAIARMIASHGGKVRHWTHWIGSEPDPQELDACDLALAAAVAALEDARTPIEEIDLVILALSTSTLPTIATSSPLCERLGYQGPSFDLKAGCAGSLYALHLASTLLKVGYRRILVVGVDTMSKYVDRKALLGFVNVGDGAGAAVLEAGEGDNFVSLIDGHYATWESAGVMGALPPTEDNLHEFVFRGTPTRLRDGIAAAYRQSLTAILEATGARPADLAAWVPHPISLPLIEEIRQDFEGLALFQNFESYGNTGSASLLLALHEARTQLGEGPIALSALGGGMRWGAARWEAWR